MKILAVDVGTGTQDILLYDTRREPENAFKMVVPSPTRLIARAVEGATRAGEPLLLTGVTMGGGPSGWAIEEHLRAGLRVFATPDAARTMDDDLDALAAKGVVLLSDDEAISLSGVRRLRLVDLDWAALRSAFASLGVNLDETDLVAVAVFDHGAAPPHVSDRRFRFDYLAERIRSGLGLGSFAFAREDIPASMTRLRSAATSAPDDLPVLAMDTAPAAVLGALEDPVVRREHESTVVNVGNMHTLAFRLSGESIAGLFEHHTGKLDGRSLRTLLQQLSVGRISFEEVFDGHGHGALVLGQAAKETALVAVTGPRRSLLAGVLISLATGREPVHPYLAVPYGDMMMAGCWGLVSAAARILPWAAEPITEGLRRGG
ncbi:MAG TPA: DUF1786 domain-containing protein [Anaerolineae bacterium]|nr:DUF1786 domain-containing protein [Anaerolineae bacterium]